MSGLAVQAGVANRSGASTNTLFHSAAWRDAVEQGFGLRIDRFDSTAEPGAHGYYSLVQDLRGRRIAATPFSDFCEPNFATAPGWREFSDHLRSFDCPVTIRPFSNPHALGDPCFDRIGGLVWHGVDLGPGGVGELLERLSSKVRTKIRRAAKHGVTLRAASTPDAVELMHAMHVRLRKQKYSMLAQPIGFFRALAANFGEDMVVAIAEVGGEPVAAMTFFAWNGVWYYKFSASVPTPARPNPALMMFAIEQAVERGLTLVDLGRSDTDQAGLLAFKEQFRPRAQPLTTLRWAPAGHADPVGADAGTALARLTGLLTAPDVPDTTTAAAGDLLYRYFA